MSVQEQPHTKNPTYERWRWTVFAATYLAYAGFYLTRKSFSVAKIGMLDDPKLGVTKGQLGAVDSAYLIAYAIGQFIWGVMGDRYGPRKVVLIGILASIAAGFAMGASSIVLLFGVLFFIQGIAQSSGWGPLTKNIGYWFCLKERGRAYGWWGTNYAIGGLVATPFAAYAAQRFSDWRFAFYVPAAAFVGIWVLFLIFQRNRPEDVGLQSIEEYSCEPAPVPEASDSDTSRKESSWASIVSTLRKPMVLRLAFTYFLLKPTRYAVLFWGPVIVNEKLKTNVTQSGLISVMFELGGPLGVLAAGYASDKLFRSRRIPVCVIFLLLLSVVTFSFGALTSSGSKWMMALTLFAIGFLLFGPDSVIVATAAVDFGTKKGASSAAGFINGVGSLGAVLGGSLPGIISQRWGWGPLFYGLGACVFVAALLLLPRWNAVPKEWTRVAPSRAVLPAKRPVIAGWVALALMLFSLFLPWVPYLKATLIELLQNLNRIGVGASDVYYLYVPLAVIVWSLVGLLISGSLGRAMRVIGGLAALGACAYVCVRASQEAGSSDVLRVLEAGFWVFAAAGLMMLVSGISEGIGGSKLRDTDA